MSALQLLAAGAVGAGLAGVASLCLPPTRRLAPRVRPYAVVARSALGHAPEVAAGDAGGSLATAATLPRLFGPPARAAFRRTSRVIESRGDEHLARLLRQAGDSSVTPDVYRVRQVSAAALARCSEEPRPG